MVGLMATSTMAVGKATGGALWKSSSMCRPRMARPAYIVHNEHQRSKRFPYAFQPGSHVWMDDGNHFADATHALGTLARSIIVAPGINGMKGSTSCYCFRKRGCHAVGLSARSTFWRLVQRPFSSFSRPLGCIL